MSGAIFLDGNRVDNLFVGGGTSGGGGKPTFTETQLIDNSSQATSFTFDTDYHTFDFVRIEFTNTSSNAVNSVLVTPNTLDAIFQYAPYLTVNELGNNQYATYSQSTLTWSRTSAYRNVIITSVYGLTCDKAVTEDEIYQATTPTSSLVPVTSQNKLTDYEWLMFVGNSVDNTEIIPNLLILPPVYTGVYGELQIYNAYYPIKVETEYTLTNHRYFRVCGIKFS